MELIGQIIRINDTMQGLTADGKDWSKTDIVIEWSEKQTYYRHALIGFFNKQDIVARLRKGMTVKVSFDINAREYNGRWYNELNGWKVELLEAVEPAPQPKPAPVDKDVEDMPF